jgi:hypothetical protein
MDPLEQVKQLQLKNTLISIGKTIHPNGGTSVIIIKLSFGMSSEVINYDSVDC